MPWANINTLKAGDEIRLDDGFTCAPAGIKTVKTDEVDLFYFDCAEGRHYLSGQIDFNNNSGDLIGVYLHQRLPAEPSLFEVCTELGKRYS